MNIYRNLATGRLVHLFLVKPPRISGEWLETQDLHTREVVRVPKAQTNSFELVAVR